MPKIRSVDPLFQRAYETLSKEAQRNLREAGLLDPAVLVCYLEGIDTEVEELAREPGDNEKLRELLRAGTQSGKGSTSRVRHVADWTSSCGVTGTAKKKHEPTRPEVRQNSSVRLKHHLPGTAAVSRLAWPGTPSWKGTAEQGRRRKKKKGKGG